MIRTRKILFLGYSQLAMEETKIRKVCDLDTDSKENQFMLSGEKLYRLIMTLFFHYTNCFSVGIAWKSFQSSNTVATKEYG